MFIVASFTKIRHFYCAAKIERNPSSGNQFAQPFRGPRLSDGRRWTGGYDYRYCGYGQPGWRLDSDGCDREGRSTDVSLNTTTTDTGTIIIGEVRKPTGVVTVTQNLKGTGNLSGGALTVNGGSTVSVNVRATPAEPILSRM